MLRLSARGGGACRGWTIGHLFPVGYVSFVGEDFFAIMAWRFFSLLVYRQTHAAAFPYV